MPLDAADLAWARVRVWVRDRAKVRVGDRGRDRGRDGGMGRGRVRRR